MKDTGQGFKPSRWLVVVLAFAPAVLVVFLAALKRWPLTRIFMAFCDIAFGVGVLLAGVAAIGVVMLLGRLMTLLWLMSGEAFRLLRSWPLSRAGLIKVGLLTAIRPLLVAVPVAVSVYLGEVGFVVMIFVGAVLLAMSCLWLLHKPDVPYAYAKYLALRFCLPCGMFDRWLHAIGREKGGYVLESEKSGYADWARRHIDEFLQGGME